ncbi:MAG: outer membrane beta-barrel family protein [Duncaniella sp.]|nr:outer membrane beta-barrel family protein [Duncaniella sp.]
MKVFLFSILIAFSLSAAAQTEQSDTTSVNELDEVVVEAANQYTTANVTTYIPESRQKKTATDAVSLLNKMAIPQLDVPFGVGNTAVKTIGGESVDIFIDYVPASAEDLTGMQTMDVKRVEFLVYPQDPRFRGAHYAINFIMQKYEWGGYTKLSAYKWFGPDRNENAQLYSKFAYKKMTFDLYADETYKKSHHGSVNSTETFNLINYNNMGPRTIVKEASTPSSTYRDNNNNITFRALYNSDKIQITNKLSFNNSVAPRNNSESQLSYSDNILPASDALRESSSHSRQIVYLFDLYAGLSDKVSLSIDADYSFSATKSDSKYTTDNLTIINNAVNYNRSYDFQVYPRWKINDRHTLTGHAWINVSDRDIDYYGNNPSRNDGSTLFILAGPHYRFNNDKFSLGAYINWEYNRDAISGYKQSEQFLQGDLWATYSPNDKHRLLAEIQSHKSNPGIGAKNPVMLQENELTWYEGNPLLHQARYDNYTLNYTWLPSNKWQFSINGHYINGIGIVRNIYSPDGPDGTLLRVYENNGNFRDFTATVGATGKFLEGKLIASVNPSYTYVKNTGAYNRSRHSLSGKAQLAYYFGNFYAQIYYQAPECSLTDTGYKMWVPSDYQINVGWGDGKWRVTAVAYKFLNSGWKTIRQAISTPCYSYDVTNYSSNGHRQFYINVSYTFGYGKKVQRGNEVGGIGTAANAILK